MSGDRDFPFRDVQARMTYTTVRCELQSLDQPDGETVGRFGQACEPSR